MNPETGAAYILYRNEGGADNWGEVTKLTASDGEANDHFGRSVAISGDMAIVGAHFDDTFGAAYVFGRNEGGPNNWGELFKLTASEPERGEQFGIGVGIDGNLAIVGAERNDEAALDAGKAYLFDVITGQQLATRCIGGSSICGAVMRGVGKVDRRVPAPLALIHLLI